MRDRPSGVAWEWCGSGEALVPGHQASPGGGADVAAVGGDGTGGGDDGGEGRGRVDVRAVCVGW